MRLKNIGKFGLFLHKIARTSMMNARLVKHESQK